MDDGRPRQVPNIHKHGVLKTKGELKEEMKRITQLKFNELLAECKPFTPEMATYLKELVDGTKIDLDKPLDVK